MNFISHKCEPHFSYELHVLASPPQPRPKQPCTFLSDALSQLRSICVSQIAPQLVDAVAMETKFRANMPWETDEDVIDLCGDRFALDRVDNAPEALCRLVRLNLYDVALFHFIELLK
jgi:hypothetical protein